MSIDNTKKLIVNVLKARENGLDIGKTLFNIQEQLLNIHPHLETNPHRETIIAISKFIAAVEVITTCADYLTGNNDGLPAEEKSSEQAQENREPIIVDERLITEIAGYFHSNSGFLLPYTDLQNISQALNDAHFILGHSFPSDAIQKTTEHLKLPRAMHPGGTPAGSDISR